MRRLRVSGVSKRYDSKRGAVKALASFSCSVNQGEFVALLGPSGCGKSTLLRLVAGLTQPDDGRIDFQNWEKPPKVRVVFQDNALFPWMSVWENVAFGLEMESIPVSERKEQAATLLRTMGMEDFFDHYPHELSGGMRQRVSIARAFVTQPDILLMDEPLRALDAQMRLVIQEELLALWYHKKPMVLYVTHDIEEALLLADRVLVMSGKPGRMREEINSEFERPRDLTGRGYKNLEELKWHIWKLLEKEVRGQLQKGTANRT